MKNQLKTLPIFTEKIQIPETLVINTPHKGNAKGKIPKIYNFRKNSFLSGEGSEV